MTKNTASSIQSQDAQTYFQSWSCWCNSGSSGAIVEIDLGGTAVRGPKSSMKMPAASTSDNYTSKITQFKKNIIFQKPPFFESHVNFPRCIMSYGVLFGTYKEKRCQGMNKKHKLCHYVSVKPPYHLNICWESFSATGIEQKPLKDLWGLLSFQWQLKKPRNLTCFRSLVIDFGVFFWFLISFNTFFFGMVYLLVRNTDGWWMICRIEVVIHQVNFWSFQPRLPHSGPEWNKSSEALQPRCGVGF